MTAHDRITLSDQDRAREQLEDIWRVASNLAQQVGIEFTPASMPLSIPGLAGDAANTTDGSMTRRATAGDFGYAILADQTYKERRLRNKLFDDDLFGEPAWDILLDLYTQSVRKRQVSVTSTCIASAVPPTTALRWINVLIERGLLTRVDDPADRRRAFIQLTQAAILKLTQYFRTVDEQRCRA